MWKYKTLFRVHCLIRKAKKNVYVSISLRDVTFLNFTIRKQ